MISAAQKERIKTVVGNYWTGYVFELLRTRGITNKKGKEYGKTMLSHVINGRRENPAIEDAILTVYYNKLQEINETPVVVTEDTKKPEGETSGSGLKI